MGPYKILLAFGPNLVASEGEEWKRQRKLVAPAFSEVRVCGVPSRTSANPTSPLAASGVTIPIEVLTEISGVTFAEEQQARVERDCPHHGGALR